MSSRGNAARRHAVPFAALVALALLGACTPPAPAIAPEYQHVAAIHRARCGACHVRVEPGERSRAQLEVALAPHRTRVHLSEDDWNLLVDYLAADRHPSGAASAAPPP